MKIILFIFFIAYGLHIGWVLGSLADRFKTDGHAWIGLVAIGFGGAFLVAIMIPFINLIQTL